MVEADSARTLLTFGGLTVGVGLLAGLLRRGLQRLARAFAVYVLAVMVFTVLITAWPGRFYQLDFYVFKECVYSLLILAITAELGYLIFQPFPGARVRARWSLTVGLLGLTAWLATVPLAGASASLMAQEVLPRLSNGTALLLAGLWALVLWFNIPLHPLHQAILRGLVPYLLVFTVLLSVLRAVGWDVRPVVSVLDSVAYLVVSIYWAWVAWTAPLRPDADADVVRVIQPWLERD